MPNGWTVAGYIEASPNDFLVVLAFRQPGRAGVFSQFTFSDRSPYFELKPLEATLIETGIEDKSVFPEKVVYIGIKSNGKVHVVERSVASEFLKNIDINNLSDAGKVQFFSILGDFCDTEYDLPAGVIDKEDFCYLSTLSAQTFIDCAVSNLKDSADRKIAIRDLLQCSHWVTEWTVSQVPRERMDVLLSNLTIDEAELEEGLRRSLRKVEVSLEARTIQPQLSRSEIAVASVSRVRRQELRISQILRLIILHGQQGLSLAETYPPSTKYENLVMPMIIDMARKAKFGDQKERELRVAQIIPKIYRKYFPVRRGRFIVDFLRLLGDFESVRNQLELIYENKGGTYGVKLYSNVIENLLHEDDESALLMRRDVARLIDG